jgi:hypothetical protein
MNTFIIVYMESIVNQILAQQEESSHKLLVDIRLFNGNILLRSFHILGLDSGSEMITGITAQEEYAHAKEGRDPQYCVLEFSEIKELSCPELDLEYNADSLVYKSA